MWKCKADNIVSDAQDLSQKRNKQNLKVTENSQKPLKSTSFYNIMLTVIPFINHLITP